MTTKEKILELIEYLELDSEERISQSKGWYISDEIRLTPEERELCVAALKFMKDNG